MERYLGGESIDESVLIDDLERAVARGSFFPVIPVCSGTGVGTLELLEVATRGFPSPMEHPLPEVFTPQGAPHAELACDADAPLLAEVVKTTSDPYVGRVSLVRVFSGTIRPDTTVHVSGHFSSFFGAVQRQRQHPPRPRRRRTHRRAVLPAGQAAAARAGGGGRRHLRDRQAEPGRNRRHALGQVRAAGAQAVDDAGTAAAGGDSGACQDRRGQAVGRAGTVGRRGPDAADRAEPGDAPDCAVVHGRGPCRRGARRAGQPVRRHAWTPSNCGCRCEKPSAARRKATAATSSSPAGTASTRCATSRWSRCRRAPDSSSSTRWSAERCRASSSRAWRRACARRWKRVCTPVTRWSTSGSPCSTARPTAWTRRTSRSRWRVRWRCGRPRRRRR